MKINKSPWIHQLDKDRPIERLKGDLDTDVVIVGAGIAGITTAFFTLKNSKERVVVIEKSRVAHGATGHNAGQVVSYFERPFHELVDEFGLALATEGQRSIELAWNLFDEIYTVANLTIPFSRFTGYDGFSTYDQVLEHLKNNVLRVKGGLAAQELLVADESPFARDIPAEYEGLYRLVPKGDVLALLETESTQFHAVSCHQKGVVNSALFCEAVLLYMLKAYGDRFALFEETGIQKVVLKGDHALLDAGKFVVTGKKVVLCTNGFENFQIINKSGLDIDTRFHHSVNGVVARMSGYFETMNKKPTAVSYYVKPELGFDNMTDPYFYLTRRGYEFEKGAKEHNLICIGGPQHDIADGEEYLYEFEYPEEVQSEIDGFIKSVYDREPNRKIEYKFTWHGLMGYTPNRVRLIGSEPKNPVLLYNLGCNGVGILPSIYGAERISRILGGENLPPSIFDPRG